MTAKDVKVNEKRRNQYAETCYQSFCHFQNSFPNKENLLFFPEMAADENEWMSKLKQGLRGILSGKLSIRQADEKYGIA